MNRLIIFLPISFLLILFEMGMDSASQAAQPYGLPTNVKVITPAEIISRIEEKNNKPLAILVFTTWCPYCKKQLSLLENITSEQRKNFPEVLAISIDAEPDVFSQFMHHNSYFWWPTRLYMGNSSLEVILKEYGSKFNGSIPYTALFLNGKIVRQFNGLVEPEALAVVK